MVLTAERVAAPASSRRRGGRTPGSSWPAGASSTSSKASIDHEILGIHHVRDDLGGPIGWDLGFLAFGALLILVGAAMVRSGERMVAEARRPTR